MKEITVQIKQQYGQQRIFPICDTAKTFATIAGTKCLDKGKLAQIESLGYVVHVQTDTDWRTI